MSRQPSRRARLHDLFESDPRRAYSFAELVDEGDVLYDLGRYAEAADAAKASAPEQPGLLYNLACCESLAGRAGDAIGQSHAARTGAA